MHDFRQESKALELLVIQPTSFCNLNCKYCYVPERESKGKLEFGVLNKLVLALSNSVYIQNQREIEVLWHAGEPLVAGVDFYKMATAIMKKGLQDRWRIKQTFQTNGTLLSDTWCEYFLAENIALGISLDGPIEIHDNQRPMRRGTGSFQKAMRGVELLRKFGIPVSAICVLTATSLSQPVEIFEFFVSEGIKEVAFNVEEIEGANTSSSIDRQWSKSEARVAYLKFMTAFLQLNRDADFPLRVREFHALSQRILSLRKNERNVPKAPEQRLGAILTMTKNGDLFSWSPELASVGSTTGFSDLSLGNVQKIQSIDEILATEHAKSLQAQIDDGIKRCRLECGYFAVCGGGSPANKYFENGSFASTETLACTLHVKELTGAILHTFTERNQTA